MRDGPVPHGWRTVTIGEVAEVVGGSTPSTKVPSYWGGHICWATPTDITGLKSRYISDTAAKITEEGLKSAGLGLLPPRSILVTSRATVGACAISTVPIATNQGFASLVCKDGIEPEFLYYHISARQRELAQLSAGSTFTELPRRTFRKLPILLPPLLEQRKIAEILSSVDDATEKTEAVIEQVRWVKQGLAQQLLTRGLPGRHTHFKQTEVGEIPEEWEVVALRSVARRCQYGLSAPLQSDPPGVPVLRMNNLVDGAIDTADLKYVALSGGERQAYALKPGDLLFNRTNSRDLVGKVSLFSLNSEMAFASYLLRLQVLEERAIPTWLNLYLNLPAVQSSFRRLATPGVSQSNINAQALLKTLIPLPPIDEQRLIVETINRFHSRIARELSSLAALRVLKSALMQVLLTGQVRVKVAASPAAAGDSRE